MSSLSVSPRHVYYWRDRAFRRVPRHGGKEEMLFEGDGLPQASWSDDRVLVWIDSRGLVRQRLEPNAKPEIVGDRAWVLQGLTVVGDRIYWARLEPKASCLVMSRPLDAAAIRAADTR